MASSNIPRLGDVVPDFTIESTHGTIKFHEWIGDNWAILFSHPADFTPICTTELGQVSKLAETWKSLNTKVIALSVDPLQSHIGWCKDIEETSGVPVNFPIIADEDGKVAELYGMRSQNAPNTLAGKLTVRSLFIIGPDKKLKLYITYPASTGRSFKEVVRVLRSLQLAAVEKVATPADWVDDPADANSKVVILPSVNDEEAKKLFPKGWTAPKPYLRFVEHPQKK